MKVSELWLRTMIDPPLTTEQIVEQLTCAALEVDNLEKNVSNIHHSNQGSDAKNITDTVITLKTPANRGDCLSMVGVARELAALNRMPYRPIESTVVLPKISDIFPISIQAEKACPRYAGRIIQNISAEAKTPSWMQDRLEHAGIRLISPIVDITNYVMLELGQPLHAFDLNKLEKGIIVRFATKNEKLITLDEQEINLGEETLIIADHEKPLALAGIMGGLHSSVTEKTSNIFLECAYFDPISIRMTAKKLGFRTESSIRFERGIDPYMQVRAIERATALISEIAGGNPGPVLEESFIMTIPKVHHILLRTKKVRNILGANISNEEIQEILTLLEMNSLVLEEGLKVTVPGFRVDIQIEEDLIEEIARIYGYNNITSTTPEAKLEFAKIPETKVSKTKIKRTLVARGYSETINYSFVSPELLQIISPTGNPLALSNPISSDMAVMRTSLWPGLIQATLHNQRRQQSRLKFFEIGACFVKTGTTEKDTTGKTENGSEQNSDAWQQCEMLSGICVGLNFAEQWGIRPLLEADYFDVKSDIEALLALGIPNLNQINRDGIQATEPSLQFKKIDHEALHPGQAAQIFRGNQSLGFAGVLHPRIIKALELQGSPVVFELDFEKLSQRETPKFQELSKYPSIRRDIAIIVKREIFAETLRSAIVKSAGPLLQEVRIFDIYQGTGIEPESKSVALSLILQHPTRTLVENEVNEVFINVVKDLNREFGAILRE